MSICQKDPQPIEGFKDIKEIEVLEQLSRIERIQQFKSDKNNGGLVALESMDYMDFIKTIPAEILNKAFIYCDPLTKTQPLIKREWGLIMMSFGAGLESPYPIYVSSYQAPDDIEPINFEEKGADF